MQVLDNAPLLSYNTFGIACNAKYLVRFRSSNELCQLLSDPKWRNQSRLILGGGSNILLTQNFNGLVLINEILGIETLKETNESIQLRVGAGEGWHNFVSYCVKHNFGGLENLSLIPGKVGAAPMQNIGAYGVEQKDCFISLEAIDLETMETKLFSKSDCEFGYRESYFKQKGKNRYAITYVTYQLSKHPVLNTNYGAIEKELESNGIVSPTIKDVAEAVIRIRQSKLPDPAKIGNAGSFFKNPLVSNVYFELLRSTHKDIVGYPAEKGFTKLAAGWLIENAGWKGYRLRDFGVHANQALVLVNYGHALGNEILNLSHQIVDDIQNKFGVELELEVNII